MPKILYTVNGQNLQNLPSTGTFGTVINSASAAVTADEATKKVLFNQKVLKVPQGKFDIRKKTDANNNTYWLAEIYTRGGKSKKHKKKTVRRRNRTYRHKKH